MGLGRSLGATRGGASGSSRQEMCSVTIQRGKTRAASASAELPRFIKDKFDDFFEHGLLTHGFLRLRCGGCGHDKLWGFSGKGCCVLVEDMGQTKLAELDANGGQLRTLQPLQAVCGPDPRSIRASARSPV